MDQQMCSRQYLVSVCIFQRFTKVSNETFFIWNEGDVEGVLDVSSG